jgi:hypothetical protein
MVRAVMSRVRLPMRSLPFFSLPNPSSLTINLGSTQHLTEMSTRNLPGSKGRPALKANKLAAICELTGILDVSQHYWLPRFVTKTDLPNIVYIVPSYRSQFLYIVCLWTTQMCSHFLRYTLRSVAAHAHTTGFQLNWLYTLVICVLTLPL